MPELDTQIRDYFEAIAPPLEVGDLVRDRDATVSEPAPGAPRRRGPWLGIAAAIVTIVAVGLIPWLLRGDVTHVPPTVGELTVAADTKLDADHIGTIVIVADGVTLDCNGNEVRPRASGANDGIWLHGVADVTVRSCVVTGFAHGIGVSESARVTIADNRIETSTGGIGVHDSTEVTVTGNTVSGVAVDGFLFQDMRESVVRDNLAVMNTINFSFEFGSSGNLVEGNTARGGGRGFEVGDATGNVFRDNTVVDATERGIEDNSGERPGETTSNTYEENRCTGALSTPPDICEP